MFRKCLLHSNFYLNSMVSGGVSRKARTKKTPKRKAAKRRAAPRRKAARRR